MATILKTFLTLFDENVSLALTNLEIVELIQNSQGRLRFYSGIDLTGATSVVINVEDPSGATVSWTGTIDSTNPYYVYYDLGTTDLAIEGEYIVSLNVTLSSQALKSKLAKFVVIQEHQDKNIY